MKKRSILFLFLLLLIITGVIVYFLFFRQVETPKATVYIPAPQPVEIDQALEIPIFIDTQLDTINAAEVYISFNPVDMEVIDVTKQGSFFKIWLTNMPRYSNELGEIHFAGGLPKPGFQGRGQVGTVKLRVLSDRGARLTFTEKTRILKNDGLGTFVPLSLSPVDIEVR